MRGRQEALQSALSEENMKARRKKREENKGRSETDGEKAERENSPALGLNEKGDGGGDGGLDAFFSIRKDQRSPSSIFSDKW